MSRRIVWERKRDEAQARRDKGLDEQNGECEIFRLKSRQESSSSLGHYYSL